MTSETTMRITTRSFWSTNNLCIHHINIRRFNSHWNIKRWRKTILFECGSVIDEILFGNIKTTQLSESTKRIDGELSEGFIILHVLACVSSVTYVLWLNGASYRKTVWRSKWEMACGESGGHVAMVASRDPWRSGSWVVAPVRLKPNISKTAGDYWTVCCDAVRSAILAIAWLLIFEYASCCCGLCLSVLNKESN